MSVPQYGRHLCGFTTSQTEHGHLRWIRVLPYMMAARRTFQLLRPHKRTRSISEMEEREAVSAHRQELVPGDGREWGKRPTKDSEF